MFNCTVQWHTYVHTVMQLTTRTDWVWPRNWTGSGVRTQVNKMLSWNQPYWTSLLAQGLRFPASNAGVARVLSLAGKWRSRMSGGTAKKCKINKFNFFNEVHFSKDNLELQWPQWRTFFFLVLPVYCYQPISLQPCVHRLSHVTPWTAAHQAPLSMDFSRQEYWSGLPFPSPRSGELLTTWDDLIQLRGALEKRVSARNSLWRVKRVTFPPLRFLVTRMRPTGTPHLLGILQTALWGNWHKPGKG